VGLCDGLIVGSKVGLVGLKDTLGLTVGILVGTVGRLVGIAVGAVGRLEGVDVG
jgi:hypothetical protein